MKLLLVADLHMMKRFAVEYDVVEHVRYYTVISAESKDEVLEKLQNGDLRSKMRSI